MIPIQGVTHISLPVTDPEASAAFYTQFLGLELRARLGEPGTEPHMICVGVGDHDILLCRADAAEMQLQQQHSLVHHSFTVAPADWEDAVRQLDARGVPLTGPIVYRSRGVFTGREVYFLDPSGNRLELRDPTWAPGMPTPTFEELTGQTSAAHA